MLKNVLNMDLWMQLFKTKSTNGYLVYREFIKLFLADSNISTISNCNKDEVFAILTENLNACRV